MMLFKSWDYYLLQKLINIPKQGKPLCIFTSNMIYCLLYVGSQKPMNAKSGILYRLSAQIDLHVWQFQNQLRLAKANDWVAYIQALPWNCLLSSCGSSAFSESSPRLSQEVGVVLTVRRGNQDYWDWLCCRYGRWNNGYSNVHGQKNSVKKADDKGEEFGHYVFS